MFDTDKHYFASKLTTDVSIRCTNVYNVRWHNVVSMLPVRYVLRLPNVAPTRWPYGGPTSKLTLGQRYFTMLAQRTNQNTTLAQRCHAIWEMTNSADPNQLVSSEAN